MSIRSKALAIFAAVALGMSFVSLQARAAVNTFDIGTFTFGGPTVTGLVGSGTLTGTFDFDDVTNLVTDVNFTIVGSGPSGESDGVFDTFFYSPQNVLGINGSLTAFRSADGAIPLAALTMRINKTSGVLVPFLDEFTLSLISAGRCFGGSTGPIGGLPGCGLFIQDNTTSAGVAAIQPGDFQPVPLPAPILMLLGALGVFGAMAMRRRTAAV